jgi:hypothetical protein
MSIPLFKGVNLRRKAHPHQQQGKYNQWNAYDVNDDVPNKVIKLLRLMEGERKIKKRLRKILKRRAKKIKKRLKRKRNQDSLREKRIRKKTEERSETNNVFIQT